MPSGSDGGWQPCHVLCATSISRVACKWKECNRPWINVWLRTQRTTVFSPANQGLVLNQQAEFAQVAALTWGGMAYCGVFFGVSDTGTSSS